MSEQYIPNPILVEINKMKSGLERLELWARDIEAAYYTTKRKSPATAHEILMAVCDEWNILDVEKLKEHSNMAIAAEPRHVAYYLLRKKLCLSFPRIGDILGAFHHTTVMNGVNKTESRMLSDEAFKARVESVIERLK